MKVYLASDHAGFELKKILTEYLRGQGHEAIDRGPVMLEPKDDYPDYIEPLSEEVVAHPGSFGIAIGGSGEGESMSANRIKGARAAEYYGGNLDIVKAAREHNNANILSLGARFINEEHAKEAVALFLSTPFSNEPRHARRIKKLDE
jgi:ribose 5-phosphate isomerase B